MTRLFLRGDNASDEFEKIKAGKFNEVLDSLLRSEKMSYFELYKCKNFLKIAKMADEIHIHRNNEFNHNNTQPINKYDTDKFDFDWYMRFFDGAGSVSNEQIQSLWAAVLEDRITSPGFCSLRTLETLHNLSRKEAEIFLQAAKFVLRDNFGSVFLIDAAYESLDVEDGLLTEHKFIVLEECGLASSIRYSDPFDTFIRFSFENPIAKFTSVLKEGANTSLQFRFAYLTSSARQLLAILNVEPNDSIIKGVAQAIRKNHSKEINIRVTKKKNDSWAKMLK